MRDFIIPEWPIPQSIHSYMTTRQGGVSSPPFDTFNLGLLSGDHADQINQNCDLLKQQLNLPSNPIWLTQCHQSLVIDASHPSILSADGSYTDQFNTICAVLVADCMPILLCNEQGTEVAALHGGWKSLSQNIIEHGLQKFKSPRSKILAWLGPCISQKHFEIGSDVKKIFLTNFIELQDLSLQKNIWESSLSPNHFLMNLHALAKQQLQRLEVNQIFECNECTYENEQKFFSYRRDKGTTGRMACLIWISD
jgi:polyphenol oxidase